MAFDIMGNIAGHIDLQYLIKRHYNSYSMLLRLLEVELFSIDRFKVLRCLETIGNLTKFEGNKSCLKEFIQPNICERLCQLLYLNDIMLVIYALECIFSVSGIGSVICDRLVNVQGALSTFVSLLTVEAPSYGQEGCISMQVVTTTEIPKLEPEFSTTSIQQESGFLRKRSCDCEVRMGMSFYDTKQKVWLEEKDEGPVTKHLRLTSALILRNFVSFSRTARRSILQYESSLQDIACSSADCAKTVADLLYNLTEANDTAGKDDITSYYELL